LATAPDPRASTQPVRVRALRRRDRELALERLRGDARGNLLLLDLVRQVGEAPAAGETGAEVLAAWSGSELLGVASVRPTIAFERNLSPVALDALLEALEAMPAGLVRSEPEWVEALWPRLAVRGRRALVDRAEAALWLDREAAELMDPPSGLRLRLAGRDDLPALVHAARASLREEGRPDPLTGDPQGFRRWVRTRLGRAVVGEGERGVVFVGYADVRLREGWLLQGVYTWPEVRRRGFAAAGVSELCRRAFAEGAEHVQLSVVEGNRGAVSLYEGLGFRPLATLRTLLFL
jgi:ribosomal protein S18 acetylase RimI-like enzyme